MNRLEPPMVVCQSADLEPIALTTGAWAGLEVGDRLTFADDLPEHLVEWYLFGLPVRMPKRWWCPEWLLGDVRRSRIGVTYEIVSEVRRGSEVLARDVAAFRIERSKL